MGILYSIVVVADAKTTLSNCIWRADIPPNSEFWVLHKVTLSLSLFLCLCVCFLIHPPYRVDYLYRSDEELASSISTHGNRCCTSTGTDIHLMGYKLHI